LTVTTPNNAAPTYSSINEPNPSLNALRHQRAASPSPVKMSSMGFSYAQIHVRRERCKKTIQERDKAAAKEAMDVDGGEKEAGKRTTMADETNKAGVGTSWASVRVHPSAGTAAHQNGGR
jgi:hypothetical protein